MLPRSPPSSTKGTGSPADTGSPDGTTPGTTTGDTGSTDTAPSDTGAALACEPDVAPLLFVGCIETTAPQGYNFDGSPTGPPWDAYWNSYAGEGTITEVGGALPPVSGSAPFYQFPPCGSEHVHQVRLVDANGETWTFGWDATWTETDDGRFVLGEVCTFAVELSWGWVSGQSFLIADEDGPRVWIGFEHPFEPGGALDLAPWGVSVDLDTEAYCTADFGLDTYRHYTTRVSWDGGAVDLRSGQSTTVPLAARAVEVTVPASMWMEDCADGCGGEYLTGWETSARRV